jgi:twitching motility protein PilT
MRAKDEGVSDLHLGVNEVPRFRTRGEIADIGYPPTDLDTFFGWLRECMSDEEIEIFQKTLDFDGAFDFGFVRIGAATNSFQNNDSGGIEAAGGL